MKEKYSELSFCHEQHEEIESTGVDVTSLDDTLIITGSDAHELNKKLEDYVGAKGRCTPFTKSVILTLREESLRDIHIVDTPGINDPVQSREELTRLYLKECDVIFILSPAGQFLSAEDVDLLDRITQKEGICEISIVATQVDNQLFGSEKETGQGILSRVLENIMQTLTHHKNKTLQSTIEQHPETQGVLEPLKNSAVIHSSGLSYSLLQSFDEQSQWDETAKRLWNDFAGRLS